MVGTDYTTSPVTWLCPTEQNSYKIHLCDSSSSTISNSSAVSGPITLEYPQIPDLYCTYYNDNWQDTATTSIWDLTNATNGTVSTINNYHWYIYDYTNELYCERAKPKSPSERLRQLIQQRQAPYIIGSRDPIRPTTCTKESRARETLFRVLGVDKFRSFLKHGFVSVRAKSGLVYQIFPGHGITAVYDRGTMVERLCVVLAGQFPPTDSIIMRYLLILNDEAEFRKLAIPHHIYQRKKPSRRSPAAQRSLVELYKEFKAAA